MFDGTGISGDASSSAFNNSGTFTNYTSTGTTAVSIPFNNSGTVKAQGAGTLDLQAGGSGGGTFNVASGSAALRLGGNWALADGAHFTGPGWTIAYGTLTPAGNATSDGNFQLTGTLQGGGSLTNSGTFELTGGTISGGATLANAAGGQLWIDGGSLGAGGRLNNAGRAEVLANGYSMSVNDASTIENQNGGIFVIEGGTGIAWYGAPSTFTNDAGGLFGSGSGQGTGGTANMGMYVDNQGTIEADADGLHDTLQFVLNGGGHGAAGSIFRAVGNGVLVLGGGSGSQGWTFDAGTTFTGSGIVETANASYTINGNVSNTGHFVLVANTVIPGPGQIDNTGQVDFSGIIGQGLTLHNASGGIISILGNPMLQGTLTNDAGGTIEFPNDNSVLSAPGGTITNNGIIDFPAGGAIGSSYPPTGNLLINNGQVTKTGGPETLIDIPFQNSSGAIVENAGTLRLTGGGSNQGTFHGPGTFELNGNWTLGDSVVENNASLVIDGPATVNGNVSATSATITVNGTLTIGGTIQNNSLTNNSATYCYGAIEGGTVTNNWNFYFSGYIQGGVVNNAWFEVLGGDPTIDGSFDNEGTLKLDHANLNVTGGFINNGSIISDPADSHYHDLTLTARGAMVGGKGDRFFVSGNFRSQSTNAAGWSTAAAQLVFDGGTVHIFDVNGRDLGSTEAGYRDNFAWGTLTLEDGDKLVLINASGTDEGGLYLQWFDLPGGLDQLSSIEADGVDIYYDPTQPGDSYLGGRTFTLLGGGLLMPDPNDPAAIRELADASRPSVSSTAVPLPSQALPALVVLGIVGGCMGGARRRRHAGR